MAIFVKIVAIDHFLKTIVKWSGRHSTPDGLEQSLRPRRQSELHLAESQCLERNGTNKILVLTPLENNKVCEISLRNFVSSYFLAY